MKSFGESFVLLLFLRAFAESASTTRTIPQQHQQAQQKEQIPQATQFELKWIKRTDWQAQTARHITTIINGNGSNGNSSGSGGGGGGGVIASYIATAAVPYVIIHHTATPQCRNKQQCTATIRSIQQAHMIDRGWDDIGYNFLIGGDTENVAIYEGRGFSVRGAHAAGYNQRSLGIALIGNWSDALPSRQMLETLQQLISYGIQHGYIQRQYKLLGHRQVKATACPGTHLFNELRRWSHFQEHTAHTASSEQ